MTATKTLAPAVVRAQLTSCLDGMYKNSLLDTHSTKDKFMANLLAIACIEIMVDIGDRRYDAADIKSFSDLHDYVDANEYGGLCRDDINAKAEELMPQRTDADTIATQEFMGACNELQDKVDQWIRSEQFKTNKWTYFC
jgi:hypothetical protein